MIGEATNVTTGEVRLSYVHLLSPMLLSQAMKKNIL